MDIDQNFHFHSISHEETADKLDGDLKKGLSTSEAEKRKEKYGENKLPEKGRKTAWKIFIKQFKDFLILILAIAAVISWAIGEMADVYIIAGVILFNAIMGFVQEYRAEKSIESIKALVKHKASVIRSGEEKTMESSEVVPGDLIAIREGMKVPADAKLVKAKNLRTVEASLTGESVPAEKSVGKDEEDAPLAERSSMIFKGTEVARGAGKALVTATGTKTEIGNIAGSLTEMETSTSAFKDKTNRLAKIMAGLAVSTALVVFLVGYFGRGFEFNEILLVTIATMVSSIPEGLPVVISIVLAIGARQMAKKNAIIREFSATEMLGSVTTILTDKTGTITESLLTVKKMFINKDLETEVSGQGHEISGKIETTEGELRFGQDSRFDKMALIAAYCNTAKAEVVEEEEEEEENADKVKKDKKVERHHRVAEDDETKEIYHKESYNDEYFEEGKKVIEEHYEEKHKVIEKAEGDDDLTKLPENKEKKEKNESG
ncbi:MAG TPA: HAD-IC family P-type ATPase, partial [Cryomorphaceae bacterium]|nr:HAD-IC family P-type ATPase [Cryomorphaceae bacterium]